MIKTLLLPFSWIYGAITWLRNKLYDRGIFKSYRSPLSSIIIGNLQVGGSGKTPMTAYLYWLLSGVYKTAILSRGYGRKTKGLIVAHQDSNADEIGDEPFWYFETLPGVTVVVSEDRKAGLQKLERTQTQLVLLDDAFQHRAVKGTIEILLSEYSNPYFNDYPMPYGRMREYRSGDVRADIIVFTKCPESLSLQNKINFIHAVNPYEHQEVFFTALMAGNPRPLKGEMPFLQKKYKRIIALSGIANPLPFIETCQKFSPVVVPCNFKDHHRYSITDIKQILHSLDDNSIVITTEKDAVKLEAEPIFEMLPLNRIFVLPVQPVFLFNEGERFNSLIKSLLVSKHLSGSKG